MLNVGDVVECVSIKTGTELIKVGEIYTIQDVNRSDGTVSVDGSNWFYSYRFKLVSTNSPYQQWELAINNKAC